MQAESVNVNNPCCITAEEYFDSSVDLGDKDIGRPRETSTKIQKFKANLSLCQDYPLTLQEQVGLVVLGCMVFVCRHSRYQVRLLAGGVVYQLLGLWLPFVFVLCSLPM